MRYTDWGFSFWPDAGLFLGLAIPVSAVFNSEGQRQKLMAAYTVGLLGIIVFAIYNHVQFYEILDGLDPQQKLTPELEAAVLRFLAPYTYWLGNCFTGIAVSTWLGLGMSIVPRRQ
jgi:hypothetical protein